MAGQFKNDFRVAKKSQFFQNMDVAFKDLMHTPVRSLMAILLMGILLTLLINVSDLNKNIQAASHSWEKSPKIVLYLALGTSENQIQDFVQQVQQRPDVGKAVYVSPLEGLKQMVEQLGFGDLLANSSFNPLPGVIQVLPAAHLKSLEEVIQLGTSLKADPAVAAMRMNNAAFKHQYDYLSFWKSVTCWAKVLLIFALVLSLVISVIDTENNVSTYFYKAIFLLIFSFIIAGLGVALSQAVFDSTLLLN